MLLMGPLIWKINLFCLSCLCVVRTAIVCSKIVHCGWHNELVTSHSKFIDNQKVKCFFPFICKFNNFDHKWHCSINACIRTLSGLYSPRNKKKAYYRVALLPVSKDPDDKCYICFKCAYCCLFITWRHCKYLIHCSNSKLQRSITMLSWCWRNQEVSI